MLTQKCNFVLFFIFNCLKRQKAFTLLKRRLDLSIVKKLDKLLSIRCRLLKAQSTTRYLEKCFENGLLSKEVSWKILRSGLSQSPDVCAHFLRAEIADTRSRVQFFMDQTRELSCVTYSLDSVSFSIFTHFSRSILSRHRSSLPNLCHLLNSSSSWVQPHRDFILPLSTCLLYTSPSPRDLSTSRMPSSA